MPRSEILTKELRDVLLKIEYWLKDIYLEGDKIKTTNLSGVTLYRHNEWLSGISESLVVINHVIKKGYYTTEERELLNLLRKSWLEEKKD